MRLRWVELCLACSLAWAGSAAAAPLARAAAHPSTAFYYGAEPPADLLAAYDQVVVEPDHVRGLKAFEGHTARPVAYLSVGEVAASGARAREVDRSWVIAENGAWSSWVMDLASPAYREYLARRFEALWADGYRGFFLDTLDSYRLVRGERRHEGLRRALVQIVLDLARRHPDAQLLLNRGFEVLPEVAPAVSGVVAESLFDRWDASTHSYRPVPDPDRRWLAGELARARDQFGLPVTVIDYRPPDEKVQARETARKIQALGFEPWVTNATLDDVGVGRFEILPRRVLILTNDTSGAPPDAVRFLAPVLEYLGYVPVHQRAPADWSALGSLDGYQGVITWFSSNALPAGYADWMLAQQRRGLRFVLFGAPGFDVSGPTGRALGLSLVARSSATRATVDERDALVGFEAEPPARPFDGPLLGVRGSPGTHVHLRLRDEAGRSGVAVATTAWGGFALSHVLGLRGLAGERAWVIDPFAFLRQALALPDAPLPNLTTLDGRRLAMIVVRPEGLAAPAAYGAPASATALAEWLAAEHPWPHSVALAPADPAAPISAADAAAAMGLLELGFFERHELAPGRTLLRPGGSLTGLSGMFDGSTLLGPIALDSAFLGRGGQAYPFRDVLATLAATESPRRLAPALVDYHGYLLSSPGGRSTLGAIYDSLAAAELHPIFVSEYAALARAYSEQVVARGLDGSFYYFGGEALRSVRSPASLGFPERIGGASAISVRRGPDGVYASFLPTGPRHLMLGRSAPSGPYVVQSNGRVLAFEPLTGGADPEAPLARLALSGHVPLTLELGGLPRRAGCQLRHAAGEARGTSTDQGSLRLDLGVLMTGEARLWCRASAENG